MSIREKEAQRDQERQQLQSNREQQFGRGTGGDPKSQDYAGSSSRHPGGLETSGDGGGGQHGHRLGEQGLNEDENGLPIAPEDPHSSNQKKGLLAKVQDTFKSAESKAESKVPHSNTPHNTLDGIGGGYGAGVAGHHDGLPFLKHKDTSTHDPVVEAREKSHRFGLGGHDGEHERGQHGAGVAGAGAGIAGLSLGGKHHHDQTAHHSEPTTTSLRAPPHGDSHTSHPHQSHQGAGLAAAGAAGAGLASHSGSRSSADNQYQAGGPQISHLQTSNINQQQQYSHSDRSSAVPTTDSHRGATGAALGLGAGGLAGGAAAHHHHQDQQQQHHEPAFNATPTSRVPAGNEQLGPAQGFPPSSSGQAPPHESVFGSNPLSSPHHSAGHQQQGPQGHHGAASSGGLGAGAGAAVLGSHQQPVGSGQWDGQGRGGATPATSSNDAPTAGYSSSLPPAAAPSSSNADNGALSGLGQGSQHTHSAIPPPTATGSGRHASTASPSDRVHSHKPSLADKVLGSVDVLVGKVSHNPTMVAEGQARKTGVASDAQTFGADGEFKNGAGGKGKHGAEAIHGVHPGDKGAHSHGAAHDGREPDAYERVVGHPRQGDEKHAPQGLGGYGAMP